MTAALKAVDSAIALKGAIAPMSAISRGTTIAGGVLAVVLIFGANYFFEGAPIYAMFAWGSFLVISELVKSIYRRIKGGGE